jgi:hypothetical protein
MNKNIFTAFYRESMMNHDEPNHDDLKHKPVHIPEQTKCSVQILLYTKKY